jgi:hypothetical protein
MKVLEPAVGDPVGDPAEALMKEAHQRKRRRRFMIAGITMVLLAAAVGGYSIARSGSRPTPPALVKQPVRPSGSLINTSAFAGHGQLAFVSQGALWVLDGSTRSAYQVPTPGLVPVNPTFSPDGKWLAFIASKETTQVEVGVKYTTIVFSELWMARADGTQARPVPGIAVRTAFGWNPHADLFAVSTGTATTVPYGTATAVDLVSPDGTSRQLVGGTHVTSAVWSSAGSALAVSTQSGIDGTNPWSLSATLTTYPTNGAPPTVWGRRKQEYMVLSGWWPKWGIGFTTVGSAGVPGGSATQDGSPFYTLARPKGSPMALGQTLQIESTGAPSTSATGWLAFVSTGRNIAGRVVWQGKRVVVCSPISRHCTPAPRAPGKVTVDPVWSPTGTVLSYAQAPESENSGFPEGTVENWYNAHALYLYDPTTGSSRAAPDTPGATVPIWSTNGKSLLYVNNNGLWLHPSLAAPPVDIAQPLFAWNSDWLSYYGQIDFSSQFAWSEGEQAPIPPSSDSPL